jgi:hypothetical protein
VLIGRLPKAIILSKGIVTDSYWELTYQNCTMENGTVCGTHPGAYKVIKENCSINSYVSFVGVQRVVEKKTFCTDEKCEEVNGYNYITPPKPTYYKYLKPYESCTFLKI